jgi:Bacterial antitoxin of type II TA system, VapB
MRTNIEIDDQLIHEAMRSSGTQNNLLPHRKFSVSWMGMPYFTATATSTPSSSTSTCLFVHP